MMTRYEELPLEIPQVFDKPTRDGAAFIISDIRKTIFLALNPIKKTIYKKASGKSECCSRPLKIDEQDFHALIGFSRQLDPLEIKFLSPTDHRLRGHMLRKGKMQAERVGQHRFPYWHMVRGSEKRLHRNRFRSENVCSSEVSVEAIVLSALKYARDSAQRNFGVGACE